MTVRGHAPDAEMSFLDHLEELRWRIIYSLLGVAVGSTVIWIFKDFVMERILLRPAVENGLRLQNLRPFGQFFLYMQVALFGGIVLSVPNLLLQIWLFVAPGLYPHERKYVRWVVVFTSVCFLGGVAFAYYVILPAAFTFLAGFGTPLIANNISIDEYFHFLLSLMLGTGAVFELPMVSFFLARLGVLTPQFMRKYRRHAIVLIMVAAALITPTPDPYNMILLALPMVGLYEISIGIAAFGMKRHQRANSMVVEETC
ncbi:MAG: twin-arginine translocase subunit TatC [Bacteroidota bacterium]|nr:twin-arginine translocase subunit TatC [Bacteroidota bacterium]